MGNGSMTAALAGTARPNTAIAARTGIVARRAMRAMVVSMCTPRCVGETSLRILSARSVAGNNPQLPGRNAGRSDHFRWTKMVGQPCPAAPLVT
jgi:hypothetical protein